MKTDVAKTITIDNQIICIYIVTTELNSRCIAMIDLIEPFVAVEFLNFCAQAIRRSESKKGHTLEMYLQSTWPRELYKQQQHANKN